ncbi:spore coat protein [Lederbergia sp. NSJ-179]|uniref:spore coat protein n=1 Tax=Lederbergia sp. NSJ-179 TaxID=2931402 RepID=UPI001FD0BF1A|nr:spore coat protein [Lederbergia sp. NSJ-179]MCJ7842655.1 spore coat protein [Lederbergia sp. NSJ-179]
MSLEERKTLAWHETLEIHELTAAQSSGLMKLKKSVGKIDDSELQKIYKKAIADTELNLNELIRFYPSAPVSSSREELDRQDIGFYSGELLTFSKTLVRSYAVAITETATPIVRKTLTNQLLRAIQCHERIFNYMYKKGLYPAYDLEALLNNDLKNAKKALDMN